MKQELPSASGGTVLRLVRPSTNPFTTTFFYIWYFVKKLVFDPAFESFFNLRIAEKMTNLKNK